MLKVSNFLDKFVKYEFTEQQHVLRDEQNDYNYKNTGSVDEDDAIPNAQSKSQYSSQEKVRNKLIVTINRVLVVICLVSFIVILVYRFIYLDKSTPDIIQNAFFTTLGWFGGALGTFFQVEKNREPESQYSSQERVKLIVTINGFLVVICFMSFIVILVYPFIYPDKSTPDIIQNAFFTTLGWFGGVLGTFFQVEKNQIQTEQSQDREPENRDRQQIPKYATKVSSKVLDISDDSTLADLFKKVSTLLVILAGIGVFLSWLGSFGFVSYWIALIGPWLLRLLLVTLVVIATATIVDSLNANK